MMGWLPLCRLEGICSPRLVRMFYANLVYSTPNHHRYPILTSYVEGRKIEIDEDRLLDIFGIKNEGDREYVLKSHIQSETYNRANALHLIIENQNFPVDRYPKNSELTPRPKLLHSLNTYIFLPRSRHRDTVTIMDTFLLQKLLTREPVNLSYIIINHI